MRVVAGKYGSRPLKAVPGMNTRPTTDKVKESLFNMLGGRLFSNKVLDFYGGSGALAIEAVSRGAESAVICENNRQAISTIQQNIEITKESELFEILVGDNHNTIASFCQQHPDHRFDLVLLDPPYKNQTIVKDIELFDRFNCLSENCIIMCETDNQTDLPENIAAFVQKKCKKYGQTVIRFYERGS